MNPELLVILITCFLVLILGLVTWWFLWHSTDLEKECREKDKRIVELNLELEQKKRCQRFLTLEKLRFQLTSFEDVDDIKKKNECIDGYYTGDKHDDEIN